MLVPCHRKRLLFYDPAMGPFNFRRVHARHRDRVYNDPRVCDAEAIPQSVLEQPVDAGRFVPAYLKPESRMPPDMKALMQAPLI